MLQILQRILTYDAINGKPQRSIKKQTHTEHSIRDFYKKSFKGGKKFCGDGKNSASMIFESRREFSMKEVLVLMPVEDRH